MRKLANNRGIVKVTLTISTISTLNLDKCRWDMDEYNKFYYFLPWLFGKGFEEEGECTKVKVNPIFLAGFMPL